MTSTRYSPKTMDHQALATWSHMELGRISAIFRYPVKSMAGESLDVARLGWHGLEGDRRFAFRRLTDKSEFPWLSASKLPELLLYKPFRLDSNHAELLRRTFVRRTGKSWNSAATNYEKRFPAATAAMSN